jgi:signal transduction histidine kinase
MKYAAELLELSRDALGLAKNGIVVESNSAARELGLGVGADILALIDPDYAAAMFGAMGSDSVTTVRVIGLRANWVEWSFDTREDLLLFSARDVTAMHDTEEQLDAYVTQLRRHSDEMEQFAYAAAHDLQEPLRTIANYASFLQEDYGPTLPAEGQEQLTYILTSAKHCKELARALLQFSLLGKEHHFRWIDPLDILRDVIVTRMPSIEETRATIVCDAFPYVWGDPALISAVFSNLLSNALKFSASGVQVRFTVRVCETAWEFGVCDNGVGFDMKYAAQLFQVFRRLDRSRPGVGIGLATCKKAVQLHGGEIWAESTPGQGSVFSFTVERPRHEASVVGGGSHPGRESHPAGTPSASDPSSAPRDAGRCRGPIVLAEAGRVRRESTPGLDSAGSEPPPPDGLRSPCGCEGERGDQ